MQQGTYCPLSWNCPDHACAVDGWGGSISCEPSKTWFCFILCGFSCMQTIQVNKCLTKGAKWPWWLCSELYVQNHSFFFFPEKRTIAFFPGSVMLFHQIKAQLDNHPCCKGITRENTGSWYKLCLRSDRNSIKN